MAAAILVVSLLAGCGEKGSAGSRGEPVDVVRAAPDLTLNGASVRVDAASPDANSAGRVRSDAPATLQLTGRGAAKAYPELAYPLAMVDFLRGAVGVVSYGGVAVRGVSTFRYETVVNVERALRTVAPARRAEVEAVAKLFAADAFYADVWVDLEGRVRRVQVPVKKTTVRPATRERRIPELITVDLFDFN